MKVERRQAGRDVEGRRTVVEEGGRPLQ